LGTFEVEVMANHVSAEKRARQNTKRRAQNRIHRGTMRSEVKAFRAALEGTDAAAARLALTEAISAVERTRSRGVIPSGTASRTVSRMTLAYNKKFAS
jgi:small subunit ribosomal protein S20